MRLTFVACAIQNARMIKPTPTPKKIRPAGRPPRKPKTALGRFLRDNGILRAKFAATLAKRAGYPVGRASVGDWAAGKRRPQPHLRLLIERATKGAVPVASWGR